ncbi:alkylated DNA repair protein alkB homolog 1-like [Elysia marginata]|uniref:Alkylated DNA repair protein alkB homolog 1-like n=1 Tax=Elysia marginata TaxID=1093978 RepID=A0AAV4IXG0_9GAST|nr:alkylated DNA repair protein alkB homolog 1-like [Elysia marginata]
MIVIRWLTNLFSQLISFQDIAHGILLRNNLLVRHNVMSSEEAVDYFTPEFKRLKARKPPPTFEEVIDLYPSPGSCGSSSSVKQYCQVPIHDLHCRQDLYPIVGLKSPAEWKVFEFPNNPGFQVILNPFIDGYQSYWVSRCLHDFSSDKANITNMTGQPEFDFSDVWLNFLQKSTLEKKDPINKLRWTTLGYHYDWNSKEYSESRKNDFPKDVHILSQYISNVLGFGQFNAEAGIVNYYHMDSTLAGHTDHSEIDLEAPLFSISFGQTAIFLLGGKTKSVEPIAVYLRSGDICVMRGQSRLAYHAVPRILPPWTVEEAQRLKDALKSPNHLAAFHENRAATSRHTDTNFINNIMSHEEKSPDSTVGTSSEVVVVVVVAAAAVVVIVVAAGAVVVVLVVISGAKQHCCRPTSVNSLLKVNVM